MDFRIEVESLQRVFKFLSITAKSNTTDMPGLVLITADPESNKLYFLSNSVSNAIEISSDKVETKEPGSVALEYGKLKSFVASFSPWSEERGTKDIRFRVKGNDCIVTARTSFTGGKTSTTTIKPKNTIAALYNNLTCDITGDIGFDYLAIFNDQELGAYFIESDEM